MDNDIQKEVILSSNLGDLKKVTYVFFDTETTGLPRNYNAPVSDLNNWPRLVQIAWQLCDESGAVMDEKSYIIKPEGFSIPAEASRVHGITTERAESEGEPLEDVLAKFQTLLVQAAYLVAHNISFDEKIIGAEFLRKNMASSMAVLSKICTKELSTNFCAIPSLNGFSGYKWPKLSELHVKLFGTTFEDSHSALADVQATARCFWEMKKQGLLDK